MVVGICIGLAEFLTFAATALVILGQVGQITNNVVSRHIRMAEITTVGSPGATSTSFESYLNINGLNAQDQAAASNQGNGIKERYDWGLYNYCGGDLSLDSRSCSERSFGHRFQPFATLQAEAPAQFGSQINQTVPSDITFADNDYLARYSHAAFWLLFIGTIITGLSFLVGFAAHRFAFLFAAILALVAALLIGVGAAIWTAIAVRTDRSLENNNLGLTFSYGNALWFFWGAFVGEALAIVPFILSCCGGRSKKDY